METILNLTETLNAETVVIDNAVIEPVKKSRKPAAKKVAAPIKTVKSSKKSSTSPVPASVNIRELGVIDQTTIAFAKGNRFAALIGLLLGGTVPAFVYEIGHFEVASNPWLWVLVIGGLIYSAITVFKWGQVAFNSTAKSLGFVILVEGAMTFAHSHFVAGVALMILVGINSVASACSLIADRKEARKDAKSKVVA